nr:MAG TPA: hypothetical protein [Caudoviricetes sp.]
MNKNEYNKQEKRRLYLKRVQRLFRERYCSEYVMRRGVIKRVFNKDNKRQ